jgi:hypothetical protein
MMMVCRSAQMIAPQAIAPQAKAPQAKVGVGGRQPPTYNSENTHNNDKKKEKTNEGGEGPGVIGYAETRETQSAPR